MLKFWMFNAMRFVLIVILDLRSLGILVIVTPCCKRYFSVVHFARGCWGTNPFPKGKNPYWLVWLIFLATSLLKRRKLVFWRPRNSWPDLERRTVSWSTELCSMLTKAYLAVYFWLPVYMSAYYQIYRVHGFGFSFNKSALCRSR